MNAYELADDAKNISNTIEALEFVQSAVPLLRQQADRIAELEKLTEDALEIGIAEGFNRAHTVVEKLEQDPKKKEAIDSARERFKQMNNEPVAELSLEDFGRNGDKQLRIKWLMDGYPPVGTKLYTRPSKQLSDEEIWKIYNITGLGNGMAVRFARAIIKEMNK